MGPSSRYSLGGSPALTLVRARTCARSTKMLDVKAAAEPTPAAGGASDAAAAVTPHLFRSPFEAAGVLGYSMPEVEHVFGTRSSDSVFWPIFQTFHTLLPRQVEASLNDDSLDDFLAG